MNLFEHNKQIPLTTILYVAQGTCFYSSWVLFLRFYFLVVSFIPETTLLLINLTNIQIVHGMELSFLLFTEPISNKHALPK
jgi:hypothetical protein